MKAASLLTIAGLLGLAGPAPAQPAPGALTTPKQSLGFDVGDDYCLANYRQLKGYWEKLAGESDRIKLVDLGQTAEGRPQLAAIVTSPSNLLRLDRYRQIAGRLATAEGVDRDEARRLASEGKAVVWIDSGLHANETLCAQAMIESVYQLLAGTDEETLRFLEDVVILFVNANPDGLDLVADWYMKDKEPTKRTLNGLPRLYQKYIGHDNNRDFYANTQPETKNLNRFMYREWFPQIVYNHHQAGPAGTVLFCPPFRDPFNYFCDPLVINGIDSLGAAMEERFLVEGKPGATSRSGAPYSTWFNGGLRTTASFHNIIGLLTETIGSPTPMQIPLVAAKQLPKGDYLAPIPPQAWHLRQSVEYSLTANRAVLDYASRHREQLLFNIWLMGHNAIAKGSRDTWTTTPKVVEAAQGGREAAARAARAPAGGGGGGGGPRGGGRNGPADFERLFHDPARRDPRGYILGSDRGDFLTATKFVNALLGTGVHVLRASADFEVAGRSYPKGSYVVKTAQAFRAHVLDMFEPQDHPNDFAYPGGPPVRPYDSAGYTPAFQMALDFDRVLEPFDGPFEEIKDLAVPPPSARVLAAEGATGFFLSPAWNDAFRAVNRLQKGGETVRRLQAAATLSAAPSIRPGRSSSPASRRPWTSSRRPPPRSAPRSAAARKPPGPRRRRSRSRGSPSGTARAARCPPAGPAGSWSSSSSPSRSPRRPTSTRATSARSTTSSSSSTEPMGPADGAERAGAAATGPTRRPPQPHPHPRATRPNARRGAAEAAPGAGPSRRRPRSRTSGRSSKAAGPCSPSAGRRGWRRTSVCRSRTTWSSRARAARRSRYPPRSSTSPPPSSGSASTAPTP